MFLTHLMKYAKQSFWHTNDPNSLNMKRDGLTVQIFTLLQSITSQYQVRFSSRAYTDSLFIQLVLLILKKIKLNHYKLHPVAKANRFSRISRRLQKLVLARAFWLMKNMPAIVEWQRHIHLNYTNPSRDTQTCLILSNL